MKDFVKSKKNIISALTLLILILAVPLGMQLIRQQQIIRSRALEGTPGIVTFSGPNVAVRNNKTILKLQVSEEGTSEAKVDLIITAPNAPGTQPTSTPGPTSAVTSIPGPTGVSPSPTPSPSPSPSPTP